MLIVKFSSSPAFSISSIFTSIKSIFFSDFLIAFFNATLNKSSDDISPLLNCSILNFVKYCSVHQLILFSDILQLPCIVEKDNNDVYNYYEKMYDGKTFFFNSVFFRNHDFTNLY
jgi:hypothetical protein